MSVGPTESTYNYIIPSVEAASQWCWSVGRQWINVAELSRYYVVTTSTGWPREKQCNQYCRSFKLRGLDLQADQWATSFAHHAFPTQSPYPRSGSYRRKNDTTASRRVPLA